MLSFSREGRNKMGPRYPGRRLEDVPCSLGYYRIVLSGLQSALRVGNRAASPPHTATMTAEGPKASRMRERVRRKFS